jgi:ABC-type dipeptide/oligopeptide/nickel transport system permease component
VAKFVIRRGFAAVVMLLVDSVIIFYAMRAAPGSVNTQIVNPANSYSVYLLPHLDHILGLDKPLLLQYLYFMGHLFTGNPGISLISGAPISQIVSSAAANSAKLAGTAVVFTFVVAIPLGILAASRKDTVFDHGVRFFAVLCMGIPNFFLAVILIQTFALSLHWFPVSGTNEGFKSIVLPALVLAAEGIAINLRMVRSSVMEQLGLDFVRTLRAKGLTQFRIVAVHAFRNALPPILALAGIMLRGMLMYTMIVEVVFRYPGLGYTLVNAIEQRDYTLAQVLALLMMFLVILFNFLADVGQHYADPRTREVAFAT